MAHQLCVSVTIRNKSKGMLVLELPHEIVGHHPGYRARRVLNGALVYNPKTGAKVVKLGKRRVNRAITLLAKGDSTGEDRLTLLPPEVEQCPSVIANRAKLDIVHLDAEQTRKLIAAQRDAESKRKGLDARNAQQAQLKAALKATTGEKREEARQALRDFQRAGAPPPEPAGNEEPSNDEPELVVTGGNDDE